MRQRHHHRPVAKSVTDAIFQPARSKKARDRHLTDKDHHPWFHQAQLGLEPMGAVGDRGWGRLEVTLPRTVAPRKAAHQRGDVREPAKFVGALKPGANHPAVELLAGTARERATRLALDRSGSLADEKKWRAPPAFERWIGLRNDPLVHTNVACAARSLKESQLTASAHQFEINRQG
jgi:hypothetical protein